MAAFSTLELMLHEIQNQENIGHHETIPVLPQRPVSKARVPSKRARRAVLSFHSQHFVGKMEEFVDGKSKRDGFAFLDGGHVLSKDEVKNEVEEKTEKGIIVIQKYIRGYLARFHYRKLKRGIITIQSFVRGENARRDFRKIAKMLIEEDINREFVWKPLRDRETTIIYLQSVVRSWLSRRHHLGCIENEIIEDTTKDKDVDEEDIENEEDVRVSTSYIRDLERQVLRVEAALREKKRENAILELQIQHIDKKWELHKAKMNLKEKSWQDELTSIQRSLASSRERMTNEITDHLPESPTRQQEVGKTNLTIREILELQENDMDMHKTNCGFRLKSRKHQEQELKRLKGRFKSWQKDFKARLHYVKRRLDGFDDDCKTVRVHKRCWVN